MKLSITAKLTSLVVAMIVMTAFAVNEAYIRGSSRILVDQAIADLEKEADFFQYPLAGVINQVKDDVRLISKLSAMEALMRAELAGGTDPAGEGAVEELQRRLAVTFREMLKTRERYVKIRLIGVQQDAREMLVVERHGADVRRLSESELTSKAKEGYFKVATGLPAGEIYLSAPDLEREDGKLTEPHVLLLRVATPLYSADGKIFGTAVISFDFSRVLLAMRQQLLTNRVLYISNAAGDYLVHPDKSKLYASALGHPHTIQSDQPWLQRVLSNQKEETALHLPEDESRGSIITFQKYHFDARDPENFLGISLEAPYRDIISRTAEVERQGYIFSTIIALLAVTSAFLLLRVSMRTLNQVAFAVTRYRQGEKNIALPTESPDEIGLLSREFQAMIRQKAEEEWARETLLRISQDILGFKDLHSFASTLMNLLASAVDAQVGVLYVNSDFGHGVRREFGEALVLLGGSGMDDRGRMEQSIPIGQGLAGQCASDGRMRLVSDVPDNYLMVSSSLGAANPRQLLLLPVIFQKRQIGVIELATLGSFSEAHIALLTQAAFNAGIIINSISISMRTEELLEETRLTAEELKRNEEELKTQQEELEVSNEEMEEKTRALEDQNAQIRQKSRELGESKRMIEEKARELELAGKYKSEFLANMSHELRTPLNSLLILARSLAENEEGNLTAEQVEEARIIHGGGLELLNLINDILDLSKVEAGKLNIIMDNVPLHVTLRRIEQQFEPVVKTGNLGFSITSDEKLPETIYTDAQRVEQVLKNLLSNAFKFTEKGTVSLHVGRPQEGLTLHRGIKDREKSIAFSVTDTGIGIDETKLNSIFEAFQQEDGSTDRHYGGTGLGLTIARKFAHMLGGEIHVASKKGQGSTFTLILPDAVSPVAEISEGTPSRSLVAMPAASPPVEFVNDDRGQLGAKDKILLLIEDDRAFAQILMKTGRQRGYKCIVAHDGKSGILLAAEHAVSAILLDLQLPDIDGLRVLDQLKHDLRTRHIPVHVISGHDGKIAMLPLRKGAVGYLSKPVNAEGLAEVFSRIEAVTARDIKKILVIEDDRKTQAAIQSLLKKTEIEIICTGMGATALSLLEKGRFDCIILDLRLPDMTGFEWLERAQGETGENGDLPPVIIYTARDLTEEENRRLEKYTGSIVIKGAHSSERLLDEVTLFLHCIETALSGDQQAIIRMQHNPDKMLRERTVLLVDDDMRNIFALSKVLKKHGMQVVIADNGQMALERLLADKTIELVIMDIMMPVMDGYQAMRAIRANKDLQNLPVIALTARAMPEEQEKCIAAGANDYMVKPVDIDRLLTLMRVWLFRQENTV